MTCRSRRRLGRRGRRCLTRLVLLQALPQVIHDELALIDGGFDQAHSPQFADNEDSRNVGLEILFDVRHFNGLESVAEGEDDRLRGADFNALGMAGAFVGIAQDGLAVDHSQCAGFRADIYATVAADAEGSVDDRLGLALFAGVGAFLLHRGDMDVPNGQGGAAQRAEGRALGDGLTAPRTWPQAHRGADSDGPARTRDRLLGGRQLFDVAPDKEERDEQGNEKGN